MGSCSHQNTGSRDGRMPPWPPLGTATKPRNPFLQPPTWTSESGELLKIGAATWAVMKEAHYLERYCVAWLSGEDVKRANDSPADFRQFGPHQKAPKENVTNKRGKREGQCAQGNEAFCTGKLKVPSKKWGKWVENGDESSSMVSRGNWFAVSRRKWVL